MNCSRVASVVRLTWVSSDTFAGCLIKPGVLYRAAGNSVLCQNC